MSVPLMLLVKGETLEADFLVGQDVGIPALLEEAGWHGVCIDSDRVSVPFRSHHGAHEEGRILLCSDIEQA